MFVTNRVLSGRAAIAFMSALVANATHNCVGTVFGKVAFLVAAVATNRVAAIGGDMTRFSTASADFILRTIFHQMSFLVTVQTLS